MKVLHVITSLDIGGAELMLQRLVESTSDFSHRVVSLTEMGVVGERLSRQGVTVRALGMGGPLSMMTGWVRLLVLVSRERPDVVHCWMYHSDLIGGVAARVCRVPKVLWGVRATNLPRSGSIKTKMIRMLCALMSRWIPSRVVYAADVSRKLHEGLGYVPSKSSVIPNGFDVDALSAGRQSRHRVRQGLGLRDDEVVIGFLGRFHDDKGPDVFLQAATLVRRTHAGVRFMMVGRGMTESNEVLSSWIAASGLSGAVLLLGERNDVPSCLAAMDVFCLASRTEGFPNAVGEAMGVGLCCVVTDVGDAARLVQQFGIVVPPNDPVALGAGLIRAVDMTESDRVDIGLRARARVAEQFSMRAVARRYSELYLSSKA